MAAESAAESVEDGEHLTDLPNPYVGPRTFSYAQRGLSFGREREARDVLARVLSTVPAPRIAPSQDPARLHAHQQAASAPAPAPGRVPAPAPAPAPSLAPAAAPAPPAPAPEGPADTEQTA